MAPRLQFDWDPEKAAFNERKHGVTLDLAKRIFDDPFASDGLDDWVEYGEDRFITVGMAGLDVLVVVWTERRDVVRLISARRATKWETNEYFDQIR